MKKTTKNELSKKITKHSALSLAIAGVADATGQVVYTDIDPDFEAVSTATATEFFIDFNDDGTDDLRMIAGLVGGAGEAFTAINNDDLSVSGLTLGQPVGAYTYALNLAEGAIISSAAGDFGNVGSLCYLDGIEDTFCGAGNSTPDGFVGVQFDVDGNTHYGWVGLENVTADGFTVTGYAFDATPDTPIEAGDQGNIAGVDDNAFANFSYFVDSNKNLNLSANTSIQKVVMHNILGQQVISEDLKSRNGIISLSSLKTGVYVITVSIDKIAKSFKIAVK